MTDLTREQDADIGGDFFLQLHRLTERLARRHDIPLDRATDFLLSGALFVAAHIHTATVDEVVELVGTIADSVQHDELPPEIVH